MSSDENDPSAGELRRRALLPSFGAPALADHVTDLIAEIDARGRFLYASSASTTILGYSPEELVEIDTREFIHPDDRDRAIRAYARAARDGEPVYIEHRARHRDGSWRWLEDTAHAVRTEEGELHFILIARDVTRRHLAGDAQARQLVMQEQVAQVSRYFLSLRSGEIEAGLRSRLAEAARLAGADATRLLVMGEDSIDQVYDWIDPALDPSRLTVDLDDAHSFVWSPRQLLKGEPLHIPDPSQLPAEAEGEQRDLERRGVCASLTVPVWSSDGLLGFQTYECLNESKRWSPEEITLLTLLGEIFLSADQRRRVEEALLSSEQRFRAIAENANDLVAEFDSRGRYTYASPSYESLLGHLPVRLIGRSGNLLIHPEDQQGSSQRFGHAVAEETESISLHRLRHTDGSWRWFDNSGRAFRTATGELRFVSVGRDITERKEMEEALARQLHIEARIAELSRRFMAASSTEFESMLREALADVADLADADRCYLLSFGGSGAQPFDYYEWCAADVASAEAIALPWATKQILAGNVLHVPSPSELPEEASLERAELEGRGVKSLLGVPITERGTLIGFLGFESMQQERHWSEQEMTRMRLVGELFTSALGRKRTESALRDSQSQLMQAQKMDAVGRLAGGIAHDFNNLLTVILGFCRPLLEDLPDDDDVRADLVEIHGAAERAAALTSQLLTFSRRGVVEARHVDIRGVVSGLEGMLRRLIGEAIDLELELSSEATPVCADPSQLEQVIVNLAVNARDAMSGNGRLTISTAAVSLEAEEAKRRGLPLPGRYVRISVVDTGCGMDDSIRSRIFDPFFTTKEQGKGTGLGLAIVYSVVEQCGGSIAATATPGEGCAFEIHLPLSTSQTGRPVAKPVRRATGMGCLLLVEDEAAVRRLTSRILRHAGYQVLEAGDGVEALEVVEAHAGAIDGLVTDVVMPHMGGAELARRLRDQNPDLRVVFLSGYPDDRGEEGAQTLPDGEFLQKPFREENLLAKLRAD